MDQPSAPPPDSTAPLLTSLPVVLGSGQASSATSTDKSLLNATRTGDLEKAKALVPTANLAVTDRFGATALHLASQRDYIEIIAVLLAAGADVHRADSRGNTPLITAAMNESSKAIELLIKHGAQIDQLNPQRGHTALSIAAYNGGEATVRLLASLGAAINGVPGSQIPLHCAAMAGQWRVVEVLLKEIKVDPFKEDDQGNTVLHVVEFDSQQTVNLLLPTGVDINKTNKAGETPLHMAVRKQSVFGRNKLIDVGAHVDGTSAIDSPLIEAIKIGAMGSVMRLLDFGANPNRASKSGASPLALARELTDVDHSTKQSIIKALLAKDAKEFRNPPEMKP